MNIFGLVYTTLGLLYLIGCLFEDNNLRRRTKALSYWIRRKLCYRLWKYYMYPMSIKLHYTYVYPDDMITISKKVKPDPMMLYSSYPKDKILHSTVSNAVNEVLEEVTNNLLIVEREDTNSTPIYEVMIRIPRVSIYTHTNDKVYKGINEFIKSLEYKRL